MMLINNKELKRRMDEMKVGDTIKIDASLYSYARGRHSALAKRGWGLCIKRSEDPVFAGYAYEITRLRDRSSPAKKVVERKKGMKAIIEEISTRLLHIEQMLDKDIPY